VTPVRAPSSTWKALTVVMRGWPASGTSYSVDSISTTASMPRAASRSRICAAAAWPLGAGPASPSAQLVPTGASTPLPVVAHAYGSRVGS